MAMAKKCDRCDKYYEHYEKSKNCIQCVCKDEIGRLIKYCKSMDLCQECMKEFDKFMSGVYDDN